MPDLSFQVIGVETGARGLMPHLYFRLRIVNGSPEQPVQAMLLRTQIQFESARRSYGADEKERLGELFGTPDRWGQTLRNKLWAHVDISIPSFTQSTEVRLPVPCTYDVNVLSSKYLGALDAGEVALLFLFSGTIFYINDLGRLQVHQVSWEKECQFSMPVKAWKDMMEALYPQSTWITLHLDTFKRLYAFRRRNGIQSWEATLETLLPAEKAEEVDVA
jgi:Family of unknown function (DUF6084)